ncbi:hypothetical protein [Petrimonas sp.]|uniref:hypothetical protein n=1 Tax=Petrimonas sp. TaxID=2023866 RepID=UPI003F50ED21
MKTSNTAGRTVFVWWRAVPDSNKREYLGIRFTSSDDHIDYNKKIAKDEKEEAVIDGKQLQGLSPDEICSVLTSELLKPTWEWKIGGRESIKTDVYAICESLTN